MASHRYPVLEHSGRSEALIEPARLLGRRPRIPARAVLCFFADVVAERAERGELELAQKLKGEGEPIRVFALGSGPDAVAICWPGIGAPFAAATLEELIGLGSRAFVVCGGAGVLDGSIAPGEIVLPTAALRDEGTSYHYLKPARLVRPSATAVRALERECAARGLGARRGTTWTTDGVYRETRSLVRQRRREGCVTVEMEAAALFAVARFRRVALGQVLYAGDDLSGERWDHRGWLGLADVRRTLLDLSIGAVRRLAV